MPNIMDLVRIVSELSEENKKLFYRFFTVSESVGEMNVPPEMEPWIVKHFGSVEAVKHQKIIRVNNFLSFEGSLFNELRAKRPMVATEDTDLNKMIEESRGGPFCNPLTGTPEDTFGRVQGKQSITASNVAKYDDLHSLVIFNEHNPLVFDIEKIADYIEVALKWFEVANQAKPENKYPYLLWNCLWKSGASLIHGHLQTTLAKEKHYMGIEKTKKIFDEYKWEHKSNYYKDLLKIHNALGLAEGNIFCTITPVRDKETIIIEDKLTRDSARNIHLVLQAFEKLGVKSFNLGIMFPPLDNSWQDFPVIIRIIDRGSLNVKTTDMAGMEVFAGQSVISSDPYKVIETIRSLP